jgi:hypothetical protein
MELLGDMGQVEARFGPFEDGVISAQDRCQLVSDVPRAWKYFWPHLMELLGDVVK